MLSPTTANSICQVFAPTFLSILKPSSPLLLSFQVNSIELKSIIVYDKFEGGGNVITKFISKKLELLLLQYAYNL